MSTGKLSRRDFLRATLTGAGLLSLDALLDACGKVLPLNLLPQNTPTENPTSAEVTQPPLPTEIPSETPTTELSPTTEPTSPPTATPVVIPDLVVARGGEPEDLVRRALAA